MPGNTELLRLSNPLGNLHVSSPWVWVISSLLPKPWLKIRGVMAAGVCLGISRRLPLPPTHSPALSKPKKGRICPFLRLLGRGCDDGGEGGSAGAVNRKPCSSARGMNLHFRAPRHPKMSCFLAEIHPDVLFKGTARDLASPLCIPTMLWSKTLWYLKLQPLEGGFSTTFVFCAIF